ncbi:hypothetical protein Tco_0922645, partial [Tanacetum coccineum]
VSLLMLLAAKEFKGERLKLAAMTLGRFKMILYASWQGELLKLAAMADICLNKAEIVRVLAWQLITVAAMADASSLASKERDVNRNQTTWSLTVKKMEALHFAEPKRRFISFFDLDKRKTPILNSTFRQRKTRSIPINRGLIQAIPISLPPQPIGEATKASNLRRIPPGVQGRSHFTYFSSSTSLDYSIFPESLKTQSCSEFFPLLLSELQKNGWTALPQELSIPRIASKRPLSKGYNDLLYKCPTHDINSHQKVNIFYKGLSTMNRQLLDSQGPIPGMTPTQPLTAIQTMADHSQKGHDGTTSGNIGSSSSNNGLAVLVNKLDNLGRDMKKLKESVHAIQVGSQICEGPHLDKDCPLNEEVKLVEEVRYGEFGRTTPFNGNNGGRQLLDQTIKKYIEEASMRNKTRRMGDNFGQGSANKPLTMENENIRINRRCSALLLNQLPPKEKDPGSFILPCSIGRLDFNNAFADLGASISIMPFSMYKRLGMSDDEDDIEGIIDYLEPTSYDGFIDLDEEEYNKRQCRLFGMSYIEPLPIIIEQVKITRYSLGPGEVYTKLEVSNLKELPQTRNNVATIRSNIMDEVFENYENEVT